MRFSPTGPDIPDALLVARDLGDVIFFSGAGVSLARARLPDFAGLVEEVVAELGSGQSSPARDPLLAVDRRFRALEREFEASEVRDVVAAKLRVGATADLSAHRTLLDLSTSSSGITRLVTTNFDRLFELARPALASSTPPRLPDPQHDLDFHGVVHIHGRVDDDASVPAELVLSSADFGRAYLSDGWATRFMRRLIERYNVVFVGYSAEDPPVRYLLEALELQPGGRRKLYTFASADADSAIGPWEQKGVETIRYFGGFSVLWETLELWAERARNPELWTNSLLSAASEGPSGLAPHQRGQVAHLVNTFEGARRVAVARPTLPAKWLYVFDRNARFSTPVGRPHELERQRFDPFVAFGLDSDPAPPVLSPEDIFTRRDVPPDAWDGFAVSRVDRFEPLGQLFSGTFADEFVPLPPRLGQLSIWLCNVAHQPAALGWAVRRGNIHPQVKRQIEWAIQNQPERFPSAMRMGWRQFFDSLSFERGEVDRDNFTLRARAAADGWSRGLVRAWCGLFRPRLMVQPAYELGQEPDDPGDELEQVVRSSVVYPRPHDTRQPPNEFLAYAVECFSGNVNLAAALEQEVTGSQTIYLTSSRGADGHLVNDDAYGATGLLSTFQRLFQRLATIEPERARVQAAGWPDDGYLFGRLRIWAAGLPDFLSGEEVGNRFLSLCDGNFWGSTHRRDLLLAMRDRWTDIPRDLRRRIEARILSGGYPYSQFSEDARIQLAATDQLNRIEWLSKAGLRFDFDLDAEIAARRSLVKSWDPVEATRAAAPNAPEVFSVSVDTDPAALLNRPLQDLFAVANAEGQLRIHEHVRREPFVGLCSTRPVRALAALTLAGRQGAAPAWAWSDFLRSEARSRDRDRLFLTIVRRLTRLPEEQLGAIVHSVTDWMTIHAARLHAAGSPEGPLWGAVLKAVKASAGGGRQRRHSASWADNAVSSPVGDLFNYLTERPDLQQLSAGQGLPLDVAGRMEALLALPGDQGGYAMVKAGFHLAWLHHVDPKWTATNVFPALEPNSALAAPLWDGFLWRAYLPGGELLTHLRDALLRQAASAEASGRWDQKLGGLLLYAWGRAFEDNHDGVSISSQELREILIQGGDDLRRDILWSLKTWATSTNEDLWSTRVEAFLKQVWPRQKAVKTPAMSARLVDLILSLPDQFASLTPFVLPRLVPLREGEFLLAGLDSENGTELIEHSAPQLLDLLWTILGDDAESWPYGASSLVERLSNHPAVITDGRLAQLRLRLR
jgi:hypothetical protein